MRLFDDLSLRPDPASVPQSEQSPRVPVAGLGWARLSMRSEGRYLKAPEVLAANLWRLDDGVGRAASLLWMSGGSGLEHGLVVFEAREKPRAVPPALVNAARDAFGFTSARVARGDTAVAFRQPFRAAREGVALESDKTTFLDPLLLDLLGRDQ